MAASASVQSPVVVQRQQSSRHQHHRQGSSSSRHSHPAARTGDVPHREPDSSSHRPSESSARPRHEGAYNSTNPPSHPNGIDDSARQAQSTQRPKKTSITGASGTWNLGKTIGAGSMGKVKLARKSDGSEQVAVKIVPRHVLQDKGVDPATGLPHPPRHDDSKEVRTAREAAIVTLLNHPYICGMRDIIKTNNHWYMLCEYVNGGQMLDYIISHGKLKEKQAQKFGRQIASALDYCHRNSIVHRDLKIENILISKTGDIKIIDFGLSNLFSPRSHLKTFCGSLYFAAPELLQAKQYVGPEVDIWSFGIVLYVLVCGRVPFDDQNMPALHAKIKRGHVDYPTWISKECKLLLSRMLVTDPKNRASLQEIMNHPWILKGYSTPPDNYLPTREPLSLPLDPLVIHDMTGFEFGPPELITTQLTRIVESEEYQSAVRHAVREAPLSSPSPEKRKAFGFDFYKRRSSTSSKDTLTNPSLEALSPFSQPDPLNAFNPLISIYYLVREKRERDLLHNVSTPQPLTAPDIQKSGRLPVPKHPEIAHTSETSYEVQGEPPTTVGRTRPRARTHGDEEVSESLKTVQLASNSSPPSGAGPKDEQPLRKDLSVGGMLRRLSTRRHNSKTDAQKRAVAPSLSLQPPDKDPVSLNFPRKSLSLRRPKDLAPAPKSATASHARPGLLTPPASAGGAAPKSSNKLGRSTSVSEGDWRRKYGRQKGSPPTSTSGRLSPARREPSESRPPSNGLLSATRARSVGHNPNDVGSSRRSRRGEAGIPNIDNTSATDGPDVALSVGSGEAATPAVDFVKPVFLKGLFSVSTTSTKSPLDIRKDIIRVLDQLGVSYKEIKGGFACVHRPSIDLKSVVEGGLEPPETMNTVTTPHRRKLSLGGSGGAGGSSSATRHNPRRARPDTSYTNSDASNDSVHDGVLGGSLILQFEIYIVKVPLLALHGVQFKSVNKTNTWQYRSLASRILQELRL